MAVFNPVRLLRRALCREFSLPVHAEEERASWLPFLRAAKPAQRFAEYLATIDRTPRRTIDFLVELNRSCSTTSAT